MKKILVFENQPEHFGSTELYGYLKEHDITKWDFAQSLEWDFRELLQCGLDLILGKYDTIATETFFGYSKRTALDDNSDGGQLKEIICLLDGVLPLRKKPLKILFSQKIVGGTTMNKRDLLKHLTTDERFIRFSSNTARVLEHKMLDLKVLNL